MFFAISGFLLYRPWVAARLDGAAAPSGRVYAVRRVLRIVPAYWVALVVIALVLGRDEVFAWPGAPIYFGFEQAYFPDYFTGGIGQAWTLTVEVAFYAALPFIGLLARRLPGPVLRGEALVLGGLVAVSVLWRALVLAIVEPSDPAYFPLLVALPAQLDVFAGGMALAVLSAAGREGRAQSAGWALAIAAYALLACGAPMARRCASSPSTSSRRSWRSGCWLPRSSARAGRCGGLLGWRPLAWVGLVSYGVYLWHLDVLRELDGLPVSRSRLRPGDLARARRGQLVRHRALRAAARPARAGAPPGEPPGRTLPAPAEAAP